ncbi:MAG TPA: beta-propeller fold lactonase family protein [Pseudorhodoplanes sp.]|nr:beta-propeller fold lactonase family protein [Pseudorhodoplanes sp.]
MTERTFVYVGNAESQDISVFHLTDGGALEPLAAVPVPGPVTPGSTTPLAISPDKRFLFAGLRNEPYSCATFHIDPVGGSLNFVGSGPLADSMAYISTDRTGRHLLAASYGGNRVTVSPIGPGGLVERARQSVTTLPNAHAILADPSNRFVFHTSLGGDVIYQQKFDARTGTLTPNDPPMIGAPDGSGPRHLRFSPDGRFIYVMSELDAKVYVYPYDAATGRMSDFIQAAATAPDELRDKPWGADIHLTPNGHFLYASERRSSTLAAFRVAADGRLALIGNFPTEKQPRGFGIDPRGRYLIAAGQLSHHVACHAIDPKTGDIVMLKRYPAGRSPNWIEFVVLP